MSNSIAPGSSADVNVRVTTLTTNSNVPVTYKTIILKKNLVNGVNTLTQEMMSATNTKYVIKYDFDLGGESITIPANCVLEFDGGSFSNGSIVGQDTDIITSPSIKIFDNIAIQGTWIVKDIYVDWMIINDADCGVQVRNILKLQNENIQQNIYFPNRPLYFTPVGDDDVKYSQRHFAEILSNTCVYIPNVIKVNPNDFISYAVISIFEENNIKIVGGGKIIGDVGEHTYVSGSSSEWGHGININKSNNITIKDITVEKCIGDGIATAGIGTVLNDFSNGCSNLYIENVHSIYNRRQGLSVIGPTNFMRIVGCEFSYTGAIESTLPRCGIDFEPNDDYSSYNNIVIEDCVFEDNANADIFSYRTHHNNFIIKNCSFNRTRKDGSGKRIISPGSIIALEGYFENTYIDTCKIDFYVDLKPRFKDGSVVNIINSTIDGVKLSSASFKGKLQFNNCTIIRDGNTMVSSHGAFMVNDSKVDLIFNNCTLKRINGYTAGYVISYYNNGIQNEGINTNIEFYNCTLQISDIIASRIKGCIFTCTERLRFILSNERDTIVEGNNIYYDQEFISNNYYFGCYLPLKSEENISLLGIYNNNIYSPIKYNNLFVISSTINKKVNLNFFNNYIPYTNISAGDANTIHFNQVVFRYPVEQFSNEIFSKSFGNGFTDTTYGWYKIAKNVSVIFSLEFDIYSWDFKNIKLNIISKGSNSHIAIFNFLDDIITEFKIRKIDNDIYIYRPAWSAYQYIRRINYSRDYGDIVYMGADDSFLPQTGTDMPVLYNKGTTSMRNLFDTSLIPYLFQYFDTSLGKPIWWKGGNWADATGATV